MTHKKPYKLVSQASWRSAQVSNVIKLDWNESSISPSPKVIEAIRHHLESYPLNWYPNIKNEELLSTLANYVNLSKDNVQYFNGSDHAHQCLLKAFIKPADRVLIVSPTYDQFRSEAELCEAKITYFFIKKPWIDLDTEDLLRQIKQSNSKVTYLCNPNNPTGTLISLEKIEYLVKNSPNCLFLIDEAYYEFNGVDTTQLVKKYKNIIISRTLSKAFSLASFRMGYLISSAENIKHIDVYRNPKSINMISQVATIAALSDIQYTRQYVLQTIKNKQYFINKCVEYFEPFITIYSHTGNFMLISINNPNNKSTFLNVLEENLCIVRDMGHLSDLQNFIRITVGTFEQMERIITLMCNFFQTESTH